MERSFAFLNCFLLNQKSKPCRGSEGYSLPCSRPKSCVLLYLGPAPLQGKNRSLSGLCPQAETAPCGAGLAPNTP